jgi:16S rRNA (uracil1498-N3)-methyltransferase
MAIEEPVPWAEAVRSADGLRLIADPCGRLVGDWPGAAEGEAIALAVGPEGGFTAEEVAAAVERGWQPISLGATLLRVETAAVVGGALALLRCSPV